MDILSTRKFEIPYVFKYNINRVWNLMQDYSLWSHILNDADNPIEYIVDKNTFTVDKEFHVILNGVSELTAQCLSTNDTQEHFRSVTWQMCSDLLGIKYNQTFSLYADTQETQTAFIWEVEITEPVDITQISEMFEAHRQSIIENLVKLDENFVNLTAAQKSSQYESVIVNCPRTIVWDLITNWKRLKEVSPLIANEVQYDGENLKLGSKMNLVMMNIKETLE